jgi:hypothetical protein
MAEFALMIGQYTKRQDRSPADEQETELRGDVNVLGPVAKAFLKASQARNLDAMLTAAHARRSFDHSDVAFCGGPLNKLWPASETAIPTAKIGCIA